MCPKKKKNNISLEFNKGLYRLSDLRKAISAFEENFNCNISQKGVGIFVNIEFKDDCDVQNVLDEFKNYALFLSLKHGFSEK